MKTYKVVYINAKNSTKGRVSYINAQNFQQANDVAEAGKKNGEYVGSVTQSNVVYAAFGRRWYK